MTTRVRVGRGPRAVERLLLAELEPLLAAGRRDPALLRSPVRVVVPSRSLAHHVQASVVRHTGAPVLGLRVQTLHGLALEVLAGAGAPMPGVEALLPILVRRLARAEPALRERLDPLVDAYGVVLANVADLLDSGFEASHAEAVSEAIREAAPAGELRERALALARVTARVAERIGSGGTDHRSALFRRALELLQRGPSGALQARAILIHGYADATGVQTDLLAALGRAAEVVLFLDRPVDPSAPAREDPGVVFSRRFEERVCGGEPPGEALAAEPGRVGVWHAPGPQAEVRALAQRLRQLLDAGVPPERIGVVARQLHAYRLPLRRHLKRLGVPFSGVGAQGPLLPTAHRLAVLLALLRQRERTPAELWLDAAELPGVGQRQRADLRLALHALGVGRLGELAQRADAVEDVPLPVRQGLAPPGEGAAPGDPHRRLPARVLDTAVRAARGVVEGLATLASEGPLARQLAHLDSLVERGLGWPRESEACQALRGVAEDLAPAGDAVLDGDEILLLLERQLEGWGRAPLGGAGAGVQVLDVMEARARSFDHLFVLGMNRDTFPRTITEDPLLPDGLRRRLRSVLPDLPVKTEGHDEERFLFAQLVSASPDVVLSCAVTDDDGAARAASPLLERLRLAPELEDPISLPTPLGAGSLTGPGPRPADEVALLAGLHGTGDDFAAALPLAIGEAWRGAKGPDPVALVRARLSVLAELDPPPQARRGLGPYFGFVGPPREATDPRHRPLYVTAAEGLARCPWQTFLGRLLRIEPLPDALDSLPEADPLRVGSLVHEVLERIVDDALGVSGGSLDRALGRDPRDVDWPEEAELDAMLEECATALLQREGVGMPGFARVLALRARPHLDAARQLGLRGLLGVEVQGALRLADAEGAERELRFRADRVDRVEGVLRLVDYKTGAPVATQKKAETRRRALLRGVAEGRSLQAVAYALGARALGSSTALGCYASLAPDLEPELRVAGLRADDEDAEVVFGAALRSVLAAFDQGSFFPRLQRAGSDREPDACEWCDVKEACLRGDSGARARLAAWAAAPPAGADSPAERALLGLWSLGEAGS
jgi:RecB family exonuclease